eukprot:g16339.t2
MARIKQEGWPALQCLSFCCSFLFGEVLHQPSRGRKPAEAHWRFLYRHPHLVVCAENEAPDCFSFCLLYALHLKLWCGTCTANGLAATETCL